MTKTLLQCDTRTVLDAALTGAGLVNYPTEWWHCHLTKAIHVLHNRTV